MVKFYNGEIILYLESLRLIDRYTQEFEIRFKNRTIVDFVEIQKRNYINNVVEDMLSKGPRRRSVEEWFDRYIKHMNLLPLSSWQRRTYDGIVSRMEMEFHVKRRINNTESH